MRFSSLGGSNAASYAAAGKSVADSAAKMHAEQRKASPDYARLSRAAMDAAAYEKIAGMQAEAKLRNVAQRVYADQKQNAIKIDVFNKGQEIKASQRKAGVLAAIGKIAGAGFLAATDNTKGRERPKADYKGLYDSSRANRDLIKSRQEKEVSDYGTFSSPSFTPTAPPAKSTGTAGKVASGSTSSSQGLSGTNLSGDLFDMSKLTTKDYGDLAFAVSSEAQLGTDDEYGVAANILTRLRSGNYGSNVHSIIHAPGQYEGVYKGLSVASPNIAARFQSPEGQKKLQEAMQRLGGRTEFKGQTMLQNRVASEDPMFSPDGNFYHFAGQ